MPINVTTISDEKIIKKIKDSNERKSLNSRWKVLIGRQVRWWTEADKMCGKFGKDGVHQFTWRQCGKNSFYDLKLSSKEIKVEIKKKN